MNKEELRKYWKAEEQRAHIHGWDFSYINDRYTEETDLPWNYEEVVRQYLKEESVLLDIDTGGGEFLLSLGHKPGLTGATEGYPPNVKLCRQTLGSRGILLKEVTDYTKMPFEAETFDLIINRHGSYDVDELFRILKPEGVFVTEQVGEDNDRELADMLLPENKKPFAGWNLDNNKSDFSERGFFILKAKEAFRPIRFFDVGALVWFAKVIEWEFPHFSVDACFGNLLKAQRILETQGYIEGTIHRFLLAVQK